MTHVEAYHLTQKIHGISSIGNDYNIAKLIGDILMFHIVSWCFAASFFAILKIPDG